ncbi:hypothetical protein AOL_s00173g164 [Orbilia oligospora ATCC 24927]|uniref:Extracellular membrane protein CFEM domain-containing protein n=1 Tax=Arthrobotrys oligospora (strain ATCC 24927 / CBS 115.81 / DSM 1491) TaxID=756982 RepID=G1XNZ6_ARTOA|nr:hypothetical protein AOL_s00173g164 [Orbilia oligospora ATCC 24927]EGX45063.1 hypothetical protein AOL_s00173g164 [Orbilia oligospora ATCC 24927]
MKITFGSVLLLASCILATPVPHNDPYKAAGQQSVNVNLFTVAYQAINEISCAETCIFEKYPKSNPCKTEACRNSCSSFSNAYWSELNSCIKSSCNVNCGAASEYVKGMKRAVDSYCSFLGVLSRIFGPDTRKQTVFPIMKPKPSKNKGYN